MKFDLSKNISPKDNFYLYVNKNWIDKTIIPKDKNRWSTFDILNEENLQKYEQDDVLFLHKTDIYDLNLFEGDSLVLDKL